MQWVFTLISHKVWNVVLVLLMCSGSSGLNSPSQHRLAICLISSGALQSNFDLRIYRQLMEGEPRVCHNCWSGIIICLINHQRCQRHRGPESWVLSPTVLPPTHQKSCCQVVSSAHKQCQQVKLCHLKQPWGHLHTIKIWLWVLHLNSIRHAKVLDHIKQ